MTIFAMISSSEIALKTIFLKCICPIRNSLDILMIFLRIKTYLFQYSQFNRSVNFLTSLRYFIHVLFDQCHKTIIDNGNVHWNL